jgi:hypothetical protein
MNNFVQTFVPPCVSYTNGSGLIVRNALGRSTSITIAVVFGYRRRLFRLLITIVSVSFKDALLNTENGLYKNHE